MMKPALSHHMYILAWQRKTRRWSHRSSLECILWDVFISQTYYKSRIPSPPFQLHESYGFSGDQTAKLMGPTWRPPGDDRTQLSPMLAPRTLLSGNILWCFYVLTDIHNLFQFTVVFCCTCKLLIIIPFVAQPVSTMWKRYKGCLSRDQRLICHMLVITTLYTLSCYFEMRWVWYSSSCLYSIYIYIIDR